MKRIVLKPTYFDKFKCIGSDCEDDCCQGWSINIDKKTYKKYMKSNSIIKNKLKENIKRNRNSKNEYDYAKVMLDKKNARCPFLTEEKLCEIYIKLGKENMCYLCRQYPRAYSCYNGILQKGLTTACIEVARLVLLNKESIEFDMVEEDISSDLSIKYNINSRNSFNFLEINFEILREFSIGLIQNRRFSIEERLIILGLLFKDLNKNKFTKNIVENTVNKYINNIENGYYDDLISKLKLDDVIDAQIYLLISLSKKMVNYNKVTIKLYIKDIFDMIEGLGLNGSSYEDVKEKFLYSYNEIYNQFIEDKEYVYENFIVNHMFNECFPYNKDGDIVRVYNELVSKFVVIKLNTIGLCAYYKEDMNIDRFINLIQRFSRSVIHDTSINQIVFNYLEENNQNTINHMILMIGK